MDETRDEKPKRITTTGRYQQVSYGTVGGGGGDGDFDDRPGDRLET